MPSSTHSSTYRPDIDGLRALAVAAVVLFHAGAGWLSGGYAGVDVFFVISGFLITGILRRDLEGGTFSLAGFYERRARRILPMFFVILLFCLVAGPLLLRAWELPDLGRRVKFAVLCVSNVFFRRVTDDYFGADVQGMPLLHTWSLSVEEQFYFIIPLLMLVLARKRLRPGLLRAVFLLIFGGSLAWSAWTLDRDRAGCFYLLPSRAWELALGGLLALLPAPRWSAGVRQAAGGTGMAMMLGTFFLYTPSTPFPGLAALLPCGGAALMILAGSAGGHAAGWLLSRRPLVGLGLISYSVYLWHWPLFTFARQMEARGTILPVWVIPALVILTLVLGWLSWRFVEAPFRRRSFLSRRAVLICSIAGLAALFAGGHWLQRTSFFANRLPAEAMRLVAYENSINPVRAQAFESGLPASSPWIYGDRSQTPHIALWGDSHADALATALHERALAGKQAIAFYGRAGAVPLPGAPPYKERYNRAAQIYNDEVLAELLRRTEIKTVILCARWAFYIEGSTANYGPAEKGPNHFSAVIPVGDGKGGSPEVRAAFSTLLRSLVERLQQAGKTVALVYPVPEPAHRVPKFLAEEAASGRDPAAAKIPAQGVFFERQAPVLAAMDALPDSPQLLRIKPQELLIRDGSLVLMAGGHSLFQDMDHVSVEGGRFLLPLFEPVFQQGSRP